MAKTKNPNPRKAPGILRRQVPAAMASAVAAGAATAAEAPSPEFAAWKMDALLKDRQASGRPWHQFFDNATMFLGAYSLGAGEPDRQSPHKQDEIYYVVSGKATFRAGTEETSVAAGSVLFVKAGVVHKFLAIEEPLDVLVFFSKAPSA